eukprot:PITA_02196
MYSDVKPVRQRLRQVHPKKFVSIKAEVEKLLHAGFIYSVPLTDWVSNIVPGMKKQGTIRVCVDYRYVNQAFLKDNYPMPFIDQIIDECAGCEIFSFMDGFSRYNQINIRPQDQSKTAFICPWGTFAYRKLPFGLKNTGATFQREMNYAFHDIKNIVQPYLDNLLAHLRKQTDHLWHLRVIFLHCQHYKIRLNPHKCLFSVSFGHLPGFAVSNDEIRLDPFQCEISSLKLAVDLLLGTSKEEACFLELIQFDETHHDVASAKEALKKRFKSQFDRNVKPRVFSEGDLVLLYDQEFDKLRRGKFKSLWMVPYIVKCVLAKGAYELMDYDGIPLAQPCNGASHSTRNLSSAAWAIFNPSGELVTFRGVCIGQSKKNITEYNALIELLFDAIAHGVCRLIVKLDSQLVIL